MALTVLSDENIKQILENLTLQDVESLQNSLRKALHEYSTGTQEQCGCSDNQPDRTSIVTNGRTTLFMPSTSSSSIGMKVVTLVAPDNTNASTSSSTTSTISDTATTTTTTTSTISDTTPRGALTIMSSDGKPLGFMNAEEVTAFRTALASSLLLARRTQLKNLTVFGAGKQAFWHIRLALLLRGHTIRHVYVINRSFSDSARDMMKKLFAIDPQVKAAEGWATTKFSLLSPAYGEYSRLLKEQLRAADAIITTVPSTSPLFDHTILTSTEGRKKGRLIVAIGSYKPNMIEIPTEILRQAVKSPSEGRHFHKHAMEGGVVVVDTLTGCMKEAGEITQSGLSPLQLVEIGEIVMLSGQFAQCPGPEPEDVKVEGLKVEPGSAMANALKSEESIDSMGSKKGSFSNLSLLSGRSRRSSNRSGGSGGERDESVDGASRKSIDGSRRKSVDISRRRKSIDTSRRKSLDVTTASKQEDKMTTWLSEGNVVYKSVGMGLMDLVVGGDMVRIARERRIGTTIVDF